MSLRTLLSALCVLAVPSFAAPNDDAKSILAATSTHGGLVVQLGIGDGKLTAALHANDGSLVHGLDKDDNKVNSAREWMRKDGIYGQVAVEKLTTPLLPYLDGMINLIVVQDQLGLADDELMRVLAPNGCVFKDGKVTRKPKDDRMDDWTHYLHGPSNNPVSQDTAIGPPENLQWVGSPRWSRHHDRMSSTSAMVSQGGRLFYIMDMGSRVSILLPPHWMLIARDAYNGMILWQKEIPDWQNHLWPLKSGPTQLTRRLVAVDDKVYVTLGRATHVTCLSAFDGSLIREYPETKFVEEILVDGKQMLVQARHHDEDERSGYMAASEHRGGNANSFVWNEEARGLMMVDTESGKTLWRKDQVIAPLSLCMDASHIVLHDGEKVVALDRSTGKELWHTEKAKTRAQITANFGPRTLIYQDVVLFAGGEGEMTSYNLSDGKVLWEGKHPPSGYRSPQDLMVARGLVWCAATTFGNLDGNFVGRDPRTGETKAEIPPDVPAGTHWFHHRCYIAKATENFIMPSRTGVEFIDLEHKTWDINHWVRGACLYGVMPANGLVYAPPHDCACYPETKLYGLNAMAPKIAIRTKPSLKDSDEGRLEKGPAFDDPFADTKAPTDADWPTYRGNPGRTSWLKTDVSANLGEGWTTKLGGKLTAITVGEGKVFVAQVEQHTLHALNQQSGAPIWHFTAGGRIDSPPSIYKGRVVFGCADGYVYTLRATDGAMVFRFRAAPKADRHMAFEGLESVWPVSGAVLMDGNVAQFVAGRSNFMDGGLRFLKIDVESGSKLVETSVDDKDPLTGGDFQDAHEKLNMPAGLADILVSDGKNVYMKSQKFEADGSRSEFKAMGTDVRTNQRADGAHVFAPMGFLDDSWYHRSYWIYGRSMAGGAGGYYQAGKFTPAGRILCVDDKNVYSYARKPEYYKWTTPMEHHLFSAPKEAPEVPSQLASALKKGNPRKKKGKGGDEEEEEASKPATTPNATATPPATTPPVASNATGKKGKGKAKGNAKGKKGKAQEVAEAAPPPDVAITADKSTSLDPSNTALTLEAWVRGEQPSGVIFVHGAGLNGYGLALDNGKPEFMVCIEKAQTKITAPIGIDDNWHHLAGVLTADKAIKLFVDGQLAAEGKVESLFPHTPNKGIAVAQAGGMFKGLSSFSGWIDLIRVSHSALTPEDAKTLFVNPAATLPTSAKTVLAWTFEDKTTKDSSGNGNDGKLAPGLSFDAGADPKTTALRLTTDAPKQGPGAQIAADASVKPPPNGYFVEPHWAHEVPVIPRGMALANKVLFLAGPADIIDEESAMQRISKGDTTIEPDLTKQEALLLGKGGATVLAVDAESGKVLSETKIASPPTWDGVSTAGGAVFVSQLDGSVVCLRGK